MRLTHFDNLVNSMTNQNITCCLSDRTSEFFEGQFHDNIIEDEVASNDCDDKGSGGGEGKIWQIRG